MTTPVKSYFDSITKILYEIDRFHQGDISTMSTPSQVSKDNPHRPFLDGVRNDLLHFDEEKKVRIVFNVNKYLKTHPKEDSELVTVLKRVLEVVQHYKEYQELLVSPKKKNEYSSEDETESPIEGVCRRLFNLGFPEEK